jgi:hypothetical protein
MRRGLIIAGVLLAGLASAGSAHAQAPCSGGPDIDAQDAFFACSAGTTVAGRTFAADCRREPAPYSPGSTGTTGCTATAGTTTIDVFRCTSVVYPSQTPGVTDVCRTLVGRTGYECTRSSDGGSVGSHETATSEKRCTFRAGKPAASVTADCRERLTLGSYTEYTDGCTTTFTAGTVKVTCTYDPPVGLELFLDPTYFPTYDEDPDPPACHRGP